MKELIEQALRVLLGRPLWGSGRAADLQWFQFGGRRTVSTRLGGTKEVGEYALHVQCAWRITSGDRILAGSADRARLDGDGRDRAAVLSPGSAPARHPDERIAVLFHERTSTLLVVKSIQADVFGSIRLGMSGDVTLEIFPDSSLAEEHWRLFRPYGDEDHFVFTSRGIQDQVRNTS